MSLSTNLVLIKIIQNKFIWSPGTDEVKTYKYFVRNKICIIEKMYMIFFNFYDVFDMPPLIFNIVNKLYLQFVIPVAWKNSKHMACVTKNNWMHD